MLEISLVVFGNLTIVSKKNTNADIVKIFATSVLTTAKCWSWVRLKILELKVRRSCAFDSSKIKRSFSRSLRPNFGFHLVFTSFHLEFSSFLVSRSFDLGDLSDLENGSAKYFKNCIKLLHFFQRLI